MTSLMDYLLVAAMLGSCLVAGIFFAFSSFIMRALEQLPRQRGIAAMQAINVTVINPSFFLAFFGTGVICLALAYLGWATPSDDQKVYTVSAPLAYLLGTILVTIIYNVPLNNRLASLDAGDAADEAVWTHYLRRWTFWNHVRTTAAAAAAVLFAIAQFGAKA